MGAWEYALVVLESGVGTVYIGQELDPPTFHYFGPRDVHKCCDELGSYGWELVNDSRFTGGRELIFKRPSGKPGRRT